MDPLSIVSAIAGTSKIVFSVSATLYEFFDSARTVDKAVKSLHNEVKSLGGVLNNIEQVFENHIIVDCMERVVFDKKLGESIQNAAVDCEQTIAALAELIAPLTSGPTKSNFLKNSVQRVRLNLKANDISAIRCRIQTHSTSLQLALQTTTLIVTCFSNAETANDVKTKLDMLNAKFDGLFSALDDSQRLSENLHLPRHFSNPELVQHIGQLKADVRAVLTSTSSMVEESSLEEAEAGAGIPYMSEYGGPLDDTRTAEIIQWIHQMSISSNFATQRHNWSDASSLDGGQSDGSGTATLTIGPADRHVCSSDFSDEEQEMDYSVAAEYLNEVRQLISHGPLDSVIDLYGDCSKYVEKVQPRLKHRLRLSLTKAILAYYYLDHGNLDDAEKILKNLANKADDDNRSDLCALYAYHGLALLDIRLLLYDEAEVWCQKAITGWRRHGGAHNSQLRDSLKLIALIHEVKGDTIKARVLYNRVPHTSDDTKDIKDDPELFGLTKVPTKAEIMSIYEELLARTIKNLPDGSWQKLTNPPNIILAITMMEPGGECSASQIELVFGDNSSLSRKRMVLNYLVRQGASIHDKDDSSNSPLIHAAFAGNVLAVNFLLERGAPIDLANFHGNTALHFAARKGHNRIFKLLLEKGAPIDIANSKGYTALHYAAYGGQDRIIELLLEKGASIDLANTVGYTPLHSAIMEGRGRIAELLLEKGAPVDIVDFQGSTALHCAAYEGHDRIVELLLEKGASIDFADSQGWTALHEAASEGHDRIVKLLLEKGASIDFADSQGSTALHYAAYRGHDKIVELLLEKGASIDLANSQGWTTLHLAASGGHDKIVELLLEKGASIDLADSWRRTALGSAARKGHSTIVQTLLDNGAACEVRILDGQWTPIQFAIRSGHAPTLQILLDDGMSRWKRKGVKFTAHKLQELYSYADQNEASSSMLSLIRTTLSQAGGDSKRGSPKGHIDVMFKRSRFFINSLGSKPPRT